MAAMSWDEIVGSKTIDDGGYVGDLMTLARAHIDASVTGGRLTKSEAGQVYASMIQNSIQTGIRYAVDKETLRLGLIPSTLGKA